MKQFLVVLLFLVAPSVQGQSQGNDIPEPKPYEEGELSDFVQDLRRFELVALGSLPLSFLAATLAADTVRFIDALAQGKPDASLYAPLFFAGSQKVPYTNDEQWILAGTTLGVSIIVGIIDLILLSDHDSP